MKGIVVLAAAGVLAAPLLVSAARTPQPAAPTRRAFASGIRSQSTVALVHKRTRTANCTLGVLPDSRCSPGAFDTTRPAKMLCDPAFHTGTVRNVPDSEKHDVEIEYGLAPKKYGRTLEIDHIISLELGGSNDISNLYPELAPGYHAKDKLENRLHALVCAGTMSLQVAQRRISSDWQTLFAEVFGSKPET